MDTAAEPIELIRARLTELNERLTETGDCHGLKDRCQISKSITDRI